MMKQILEKRQDHYLELFSGCQKALKLLLRYLGLPEIHEPEYELQRLILDPLEVDQRMLMGIIDQDLLEERAAGTEDHLVRLDLLVIIAGQSYVTEVILVEMIPE